MSKVLFFAPFGSFQVHHQVDALLACALRARGHEVQFLACAGTYGQACDVVAWTRERFTVRCEACASAGRELLERYGLPYHWLHSYLRPDDIEKARQWAHSLPADQLLTAEYFGTPIGAWVASSVCGYFRVTEKLMGTPRVQPTHRQILANGLITYWALERFYEAQKPDAVSVFNGRYAPYRIAYEVARAKGIRVLSHERGFIDNTFLFTLNHIVIATAPMWEAVQKWADTPLTPEEFLAVKSYLVARETGKGFNFAPFYEYRSECDSVRDYLRIPVEARIVALFTSSEFEFAFCKDFSTLTEQHTLVANAIEAFRGRSEYLVVRHHPYMSGNDIATADTDFIGKSYKLLQNVPPNVRILQPDEKLTSYALLPHIDACIAPFTTLGVEAAARGIPSVCAQESPYQPAFQRVLQSFEQGEINAQVDAMLSQDRATLFETQVPQAYRALAALNLRMSKSLKHLGIRDITCPDIRFTTADELAEGSDASLDEVLASLLDGASLVAAPSEERKSATARTCETALFRDLEGELSRQKHEVQIHTQRYRGVLSAEAVALIAIGETPRALQSRHAHCLHYNLPSAQLPRACNLSRFLRNEVKERFVLIATEGIQHDPAFIPWALRTLEIDPSAHGARAGAWILDDQGEIGDELFTKRCSPTTFLGVSRIIPWIARSWGLLSLVLFERTWLADELDKIASEDPSIEETAAALTILDAEGILRSPSPLVLIPRRRARLVPVLTTERCQGFVQDATRVFETDDMSKVALALRALRELDIELPDLDLLFAVCMLKLGDPQEALRAVRCELERDPSHERAKEIARIIAPLTREG